MRTKIVAKLPSTKKSSLGRHNENTQGKRKYKSLAKTVTAVKNKMKNKKNPGEKEITDQEVIEEGGKGNSGQEISPLSSSNIETAWQTIHVTNSYVPFQMYVAGVPSIRDRRKNNK